MLDTLFLFLAIFAFGLFLAQFIIGVKLSTEGVRLTNLNKELNLIISENQEIQEKLVETSSLSAVAKKALEEGFIRAQIIYLTPVEDHALIPSTTQ